MQRVQQNSISAICDPSFFVMDVIKTNTLGFGALKASGKVGNNNVSYLNKYLILAETNMTFYN